MVSPPQYFKITRSDAIFIFRKKNKGLKNWIKVKFMKNFDLEEAISNSFAVYSIY